MNVDTILQEATDLHRMSIINKKKRFLYPEENKIIILDDNKNNNKNLFGIKATNYLIMYKTIWGYYK